MNNGVKIGLRVLMYYGMLMLLSLLFLGTMTGVLQIVLNVLLLGGFLIITLNDGGYQGEKASTAQAMLDKQRAEGHVVDASMEKQTFKKGTALALFLTAALPLLAFAAVNLACEPMYPEVVIQDPAVAETTPAPETAMQYDEGAFPESDYTPEEAEPVSPVTYLMVVTRVLFIPFAALYTLVPAHTLYVLFLPLSLLFPAVSAIGYLNGPRLREKKLKDIEKGKKRKMRNLRVNKKPRQPKQPKPEV